MKKINILYKKFLLCLFILGICNYVCSCSSDDDAEDTVEIDLNTVQDCDSISVDFRLVNSEGRAVKTFKEGEQILFRLTVTNTTEKWLKNCQSPANIVGVDMFQVYSKGKSLGRPWDFTLTYCSPRNQFWVEQIDYVYECPWQGQVLDIDKENYREFHVPSSGVVFIKKQDQQPLPVGQYYTEFRLTLSEDNVITCHKDFSIIAK